MKTDSPIVRRNKVAPRLLARPIAIFDSGVGGLTVYRAVRARLPNENLIYFGDTAHVPYGTRSPATVTRLVRAHADFLARRNVKCLVVACNTASAVALEVLRRRLPFPVIGVIDPGVRYALSRTRNGRVGVVGTRTTIASGAYQRGLREGGHKIRVFPQACPLFVPLAEEGWSDHEITRIAARKYLSSLRKARVDTVILGCTHYPLMKRAIGSAMGRGVELVDSAEVVAEELARQLEKMHLVRKNGVRGSETFFLTDTGGSFRSVAERFLGRPIGRMVKVRVTAIVSSGISGGRQ